MFYVRVFSSVTGRIITATRPVTAEQAATYATMREAEGFRVEIIPLPTT